MGSEALRLAVLAEAKTWLGTPWRHNEAVKGQGVDCGQFPLSVYRSLGLIGTDSVDDYPIDWALHQGHERYLEIVMRYCLPVDAPQPGDIVVFKFGRSYSHGAIALDYPLIIHALRGEKAGVVFDNALQGELKRRDRQFYSYFATARDGGSVVIGREPMRPTARDGGSAVTAGSGYSAKQQAPVLSGAEA